MTKQEAARNMDDVAGELGSHVRERRRKLGIRQEELADLAGVSPRFVHSLEHGKPTMRLDKVLAVLDVLGLELEVGVRQ